MPRTKKKFPELASAVALKTALEETPAFVERRANHGPCQTPGCGHKKEMHRDHDGCQHACLCKQYR